MGRHIVSFATRTKPMATSSTLLGGCPTAAPCAFTSAATASMAALRGGQERVEAWAGGSPCSCGCTPKALAFGPWPDAGCAQAPGRTQGGREGRAARAATAAHALSCLPSPPGALRIQRLVLAWPKDVWEELGQDAAQHQVGIWGEPGGARGSRGDGATDEGAPWQHEGGSDRHRSCLGLCSTHSRTFACCWAGRQGQPS